MKHIENQEFKTHSDFGGYLVERGYISSASLKVAHLESQRLNCSLDRSLIAANVVKSDVLSQANARFLNIDFININMSPPDTKLANIFEPATLVRYCVVPWRKKGSKVILLCESPEAYSAFLSHLDTTSEKYEFALGKRDQILSWLMKHHEEELRGKASARVPESESCRGWARHTSQKRLIITLLGLTFFLALILAFPKATLGIFALWAIMTLFVSALLRLSAFAAELSSVPNEAPPVCPDDQLPTISVLVPLFKEREIATALLQRLTHLTYPKALLDVALVVEVNDTLTKAVLSKCSLPPWIRIIEVPEGTPKTKPRAMNYALDFCKGDIIGIWDAEDAPADNQLEIVANYFHSASPELVCLQGVLDYYNSRQNWLARCFTIEYAAWFRLILPGMAKLGFAIPLGGTTLFFRRNALESLGGWDAHNVTEDADLGFRLARHGYRTDVIPTRTGEEANCRIWPWIKQRSRWLKGYMVTYFVHMREPAKLYRQIGLWRFIGFQAHFVTALSQFILAPVLWSFWLVLFGLPHPLEAYVSHEILVALGLSFLAIELANALINASAVSKPELKHLFAWVPIMHFYYPLGALAAYKALFELVAKPFYWDKTQHGLSLSHLQEQTQNSLPPRLGSVELESGHKSL
ncbi:glycosyltransferase family 2 protein [Lentibacter sp.]|uniref:glycosyltransferase family 2 protein n=1 Tax=Lentibacter sp. TaxID=2024994 RepID=UPI003F6A3778